MVSLSLDNVFPPDKKDWYYIYFESIGKWNSDPKGSEEVKDIGIDRDYSITENPMLRKIDKSSLAKAQEKVQEQRIENYANLLVACCSRLNQLNGIIGNLGDAGWVEQIHKCKEKYPIDLMDLNQYIDDVIETESAEDYEENLMMQAFFAEVFGSLGVGTLGLANTFRDDIVNDIFKYSKGVEDYFEKAMKCLKYIKRYRTWEKMNDYDKFFYAADAILDVADRYTDTPICEMLKVYSKVGRSLAQKAHELGEEYYENYAPSKLKANVDTENKFAYNVSVDFKIMVIPDCWYNIGSFLYFNFEKNGTEPIREVVVKVHNHPSFENEVATLLFDLVPVSDGVMLKQTSIQDANALEDGYPINRMWMEIKWKNGRTTKVPLRADVDGVELGNSPHNATVNQYTVHLHSATSKFKNMADEIEIKE